MIEPPMPDFFAKVKAAVGEINVSFRANRKVSGGLHDETNYSAPKIVIEGEGKRAKSVEYRHVRKPIANMSKNEVENIADPTVRKRVLEKLEALGTDDPKKLAGNEPYLRSKDGSRLTPIYKARIRKSVGTMTIGKEGRERHVAPGNNHHMEIFALLNAKGEEIGLDWKVVTLFDTVQRVKQKKPAICHSYEEYAEDSDENTKKKHRKLGIASVKFKFSLAKGEYVEATLPGESKVLLQVCYISEGDMSLCLHTDARTAEQRKKTGDYQKYRIASIARLKQLNLVKVTVDVLGNIHPAND
jgi:CRISPR-associated endonuclease Csn1